MKIATIVIGERVRKDMGDIESLAESIKRHGLLHPIVIKTDNTLVAGHRRIEAARSIGWKEIPVTVINVEDLLSAERDENTERKDFTPTEAVAIGKLIEEQEKPRATARRFSNLRNQGAGRSADSAERGDVRGMAATAVGMGHSKYTQAKEVVASAEADPATFGDLPERMDETGNVSGAHHEMKRRQGANGNDKGNGKRKLRHPVFRKMHYPKPNRTVERTTYALDGICTVLATIEIDQLDPTKTEQWSVSLKKFSSSISAFARRLADVKG